MPMGLDVIVRLHDRARLPEFDRALFSLVNQTFAPVRPIIATQAFDAAMAAETRAVINKFDWHEAGHAAPTIIDVPAAPGQDLRSRLLNAGISHTRHRFLAFLDCDDYLYEDAYDYLVREAVASNAVITFGGIVCKHVRVLERFVYAATASSDIFHGTGLTDLMVNNFCPIHSFVIDRSQVAPDDLVFNTDLERLEDYDLLLRICAKYSSRFESRLKAVGVYNWHLDGRGSIPFSETDPAKAAVNKRAWANAKRHIWRVKSELRSKSELPPRLNGGQRPEPNTDGGLAGGIPLLFPLGHFYSPIADPTQVRAREARLWARKDTMDGIDLRLDAQLSLLHDLKPYAASINYPLDDPGDNRTYYYKNDQYPVLDAEFLHTALCHFRPRVMIEVGSGFSSLIVAETNCRLLDNGIDFTCIEPYPRQFLIDGVEGITRLIREKVEDTDLPFFDRLNAGDILFIDSSHISKVGSDVNYLFFDVLPRVKPGVLIHIHDIFLPDEYPKQWMIDQGRNWNEQYLLRAFLEYNGNFEVVWAAHFIGTRYTAAVQAVFPRYPDLGGGGSFWIRRVG